ncbi:MAG: prepilin-type N-terminal cleavage/methylation domain-containing protein [Oligoflexia bacterium]|nr:prepilin-type N-terminal cleavage/methylation domain-containing protein [Oligoflexia bacterium]
MRANHGFTLIEILIAVSIFVILMVAIFTLLQNTQIAADRTMVYLDRQANLSLMIQVLKRDGLGSALSFGNIKGTDDSGRLFFEHNPSCIADCERKLTLSSDKGSFVFITTGFGKSPAVPYDPPKAYVIGEPSVIDDQGTLTFQSLNKDGYFDGIAPGYWTQGNLIALYSPNPVNAYDSTGVVDLSVPARPLAYLGYVNGDRLSQAIPADFVTVDPSGNAIPNEDVFFRRLTGVGGGTVLPLAQPVQAVKYALVPRTPGGGFNLVRSLWTAADGGGFSQTSVTLEGVASVTFKRPTIAQTEFAFDIRMSLVKMN